MAVGKIGPFDIAKDNWDLYVDRLDQYFVANDVKAAVQVATLITVVGSEAYELMVNLCTPDKPSTKSYVELVAVMKKHVQPKPSVLAERFKFRQRTQKNDETVAEYVAALKKLVKDCGFTATSLTENIRDQFVCGIKNESIRQRLFTEDEIAFERAFSIAVSMEAAEGHAAMVQDRTVRGDGAPSGTSVHKLYTAKRETRRPAPAAGARAPQAAPGGGARGMSGADGDKRASFRRDASYRERQTALCSACGGQHATASCRFKVYVCKVCNKEGHLKKMCPNMNMNMVTEGSSFHAMLERQVGYSDGESSGGSDEVNNFSLDVKTLKRFGPYKVQLQVNNVKIVMEIDTGSAIACISYDCYKQLFNDCKLQKSDLSLRYYTGEIVKPVGKISPLVRYKDKCKELELYIVDKGKTSLIGRQWLKELEIQLPLVNCNHVSGLTQDFNLANFSSSYCEVFEDGLGKFTGGTVGFRVRAGAAPVFLRARPLAYALREPVERALDQLVRDGVITPVNSSDWATPIVPVMKKDGTIRMVNKNGKVVIECQHGSDECYGNKLHACAINILNNATRSEEYNSCMMSRYWGGEGSTDMDAINCGERLKVFAQPIIHCASSQKGEDLAEYYGNETAKVHFKYVPYILVNGKQFTGEDQTFMGYVCAAFTNPPVECKQ